MNKEHNVAFPQKLLPAAAHALEAQVYRLTKKNSFSKPSLPLRYVQNQSVFAVRPSPSDLVSSCVFLLCIGFTSWPRMSNLWISTAWPWKIIFNARVFVAALPRKRNPASREDHFPRILFSGAGVHSTERIGSGPRPYDGPLLRHACCPSFGPTTYDDDEDEIANPAANNTQ